MRETLVEAFHTLVGTLVDYSITEILYFWQGTANQPLPSVAA